MQTRIAILLFYSCLIDSYAVGAANILMSALYGEGSHFLAAAAIGEELVSRGHDVTMLISNGYEHRATDPKFANFSFEIFNHVQPVDKMRSMLAASNQVAFREADQQFLYMLQLVAQSMVDDCRAVVTDREMMRRMEKMDVLVVDVSWPCGLYIKSVLDRDRSSPKELRMVAILLLLPGGVVST